MNRPTAIALTIAALAALPFAAAAAQPLDGRSFVVESGPKGKPADDAGNVLTFKDGTMHSASCDRHGFAPGPYKATVDGDVVRFEGETLSPSSGRQRWSGTVRRDTIDVAVVYQPKGWLFNRNPQPIELWAKGNAR